MTKLYLWVVAEILLFLVSVGIILPDTISAPDTFYVAAGIVYIVFALPVLLWLIPYRIYDAYCEVEKGFPNGREETNPRNVDPDWPSSVQQSAPPET